MKLNIILIAVLVFSTLFVTSQTYAPCIEGPGINCNNYPPQALTQIKSDKMNYETSDKPVITISGVPSTVAHLEIDDSSSNIIFTHDINLSSNGTARYVLDISYYKPDVYSATATSLVSKVTTGFSVGLVPTGGRIVINSDRNSYLPGDNVAIVGTWNSNTLIQLSLIDPSGISVKSSQTFSDKTGHFLSSDLVIPMDAISGIWQIGADSGMTHARIQISINSTVDNHSKIKLDKAAILSPLKQFKSGIKAEDVKCNTDFELVIKSTADSPACVKPETAQKLVERGWAISLTDLKPWVKIDTPSLNNTYVVNQPISFSVTVKGFGNYPCVSPQIKIHDNKNPNVPVFQDNGSTMSCPALRTSDNYSFDFPGNNSQYVIILNKTGDYTMTISYGNNSVQKYFSVVLPSNLKSITILENNAGIVLLKSQTYYFETPNYANDAYAHPVQVSFHDVLFTLFPPGFRGGLPSGGCMEKGPGLGQYYWTDAKFADDAHELLHIFADSPSCTGTIPSMFSNHTNPQAGLTFYDGKMKLLVSTNVTDSTGHDIIIQPLGQTRDISNKTDDTKLQVHLLGGSGSVNIRSDKFNQTGFFSGNVGQVIKGLPVEISISDPYDMFVRKYAVPSTSISQDGSFNFTHTFIGKYDQDIYSLDFSYGNQKYELKYFPVVPP